MTRPRLKRLFGSVFARCSWRRQFCDLARDDSEKRRTAEEGGSLVKEMGGNVTYGYEIDVGLELYHRWGDEFPKAEPPGPKWLRADWGGPFRDGLRLRRYPIRQSRTCRRWRT